MKQFAGIRWIWLVPGTLLLFCSAFAQSPGAQQIYESNQAQGLKVSVELKREAAIRRVTPQTLFQTGDQIKLHFTSNFDGYVYALNETPSGRIVLLFPREDTGTANLVHSGRDYVIPSTDGWFRFAGRPGVEKIHIIASSHPLAEVETRYRPPTSAALVAPTRDSVVVRPQAYETPAPIEQPPSAAQLPVAAQPDINPDSSSSTPQPAPQTNEVPVQQSSEQQSPVQQLPQKLRQQKIPGTSGIKKGVGAVKGGISVTKSVTSLPKDVVGIFKGIRPRDLVLEDDEQEGVTYVSSVNSLSEKPVYFTVELVHQ